MLFLQILTAFILHLTTWVAAADTAAWKSRSIYFVLTDRIARSNSDSGGGSCTDLGNYCGGTFKGLESKLDYIKNLGFDAIWITPVVSSEASLVKVLRITLTSLQTALADTMDIGPRIYMPSTQIMVVQQT
jgi:alpha-amylase